MMSRVHSLLATTAMTPSERRLGRFLRAPEGHEAGGGAPPPSPAPSSQPSGANNGAGNSADSGGIANSDGNNAGQAVDPATFWGEPVGDTSGGSSSGDSASSGASSAGPKTNQGGNSGDANQGQEFGKQLASQIQGLAMPTLFTPEIAEQISGGNLEGINGAMRGFGQEAVRQSVLMNAQLMQKFGETLTTRVQTMIANALGQRDNNETLLESFPSAKDPAARPLIESVFNQALKHTGGDRTKAVSLARDMLKLVGKGAVQDLGLNQSPATAEDTFTQGSSTLIDELLGRS